jgi:hypothetical protein
MPNYACQIVIFPTSNLNADAISNNWSCVADNVSAAGDFITSVIDCHRDMQPLYPSTVRQNNHTYKIYDRADPIPRNPVTQGTWNFATAPSGNPLPPEVSMCLSFQGTPESGVSQARKRGRIFVGPLNSVAMSTTGRPTTSAINTMVAAGQELLDESDAAATWSWQVWSASTGDSFPVVNGWVDDEFDTQRRRGRLATTRTTFQ